MTPFEMFIIIWLSGLTGSALLCDVLPRLLRRMNKYDRRVKDLGRMGEDWRVKWR